MLGPRGAAPAGRAAAKCVTGPIIAESARHAARSVAADARAVDGSRYAQSNY